MRKNLLFIKHISAKILAIEYELRKRVQELAKDDYIRICEGHSAPNLGALIKLIEEKRLQEAIFVDFKINFTKYYAENSLGVKNNKSSRPLFRYRQINIALNLYRCIRNRAFHGANMFKIYEKNGKIAPRIFTQVYLGTQLLNFGVEPAGIELFLDDLGAILRVFEWEFL